MKPLDPILNRGDSFWGSPKRWLRHTSVAFSEEKIQTESMWIELPRLRLDTLALETSAEIQEDWGGTTVRAQAIGHHEATKKRPQLWQIF